MSAQGAIRDLVQGVMDAVVSALHGKDEEQDKRMDAIEERLGALESPPPSAAPRARKNVKAQASTATGTGEAPNAGSGKAPTA